MKYLLLLLFTLSLFSCKNIGKTMYLATDDPSVIDAANLFNSSQTGVKIIVQFIDSSGEGIFSHLKKDESYKYDLLAGSYFPLTRLDESRCASINKQEINQDSFPIAADFYNFSNGKALLYSIDFPVIVSKKGSSGVPEKLTLENFRTIVENGTRLPETSSGQYNFPFIPELSSLPQLEFLLLGLKECNFMSEESKQSVIINYNYFNNFFTKKLDTDTAKKILTGYSKVDEKYYLVNNIFKYDFSYYTNAAALPQDQYKISFIENINSGSLKQKIITINKKSFLKNEALLFIKALMSEQYQKYMANESFKMQTTYESVFIPVNRAALTGSLYSLQGYKELVTYAEKLTYCNFGTPVKHRQFIESYTIANDMISRERLKKDGMIDFISQYIRGLKK